VRASSEADLTRGSVYPSSEEGFTRGAFAAWYWQAAGATMVVITLCMRLGVRVDLCFVFFQVLSGFPPGYLGDP
jgi:hypothetical protein